MKPDVFIMSHPTGSLSASMDAPLKCDTFKNAIIILLNVSEFLLTINYQQYN
jgi:hypothetical protein